MKEHSMFLRFYGVTQEQLKTCFSELRPMLIGVIKATEKPLTVSCNVLLPELKAGQKNVQVDLYFDSEAHKDAAYNSAEMKAIYTKYAAPGQSSKLITRKKGDSAFGFHTN